MLIFFFFTAPLDIWPISPEPTQQASRPIRPMPLFPFLLPRAGQARRRPSPAAPPSRLPPTSCAMEQTLRLSPSLIRSRPPSPLLNSAAFPPSLLHSGNGTIEGHHLPSLPALPGRLHLPLTPIKGCLRCASPYLTHTVLLAISPTPERAPTTSLRQPLPFSIAQPPRRHRRSSSAERLIEFPVRHSPSPALGRRPRAPERP
jgi:hypothetical protein